MMCISRNAQCLHGPEGKLKNICEWSQMVAIGLQNDAFWRHLLELWETEMSIFCLLLDKLSTKRQVDDLIYLICCANHHKLHPLCGIGWILILLMLTLTVNCTWWESVPCTINMMKLEFIVGQRHITCCLFVFHWSAERPAGHWMGSALKKHAAAATRRDKFKWALRKTSRDMWGVC